MMLGTKKETAKSKVVSVFLFFVECYLVECRACLPCFFVTSLTVQKIVSNAGQCRRAFFHVACRLFVELNVLSPVNFLE